jgi:ribulose-phosphate 3-epimerase
MQIIPVVMEKQWDAARARLESIYLTNSWVQIDITDGEFVAGKSFEMELLNKFEFNEKMLWDIHLLVKEPARWIEKCVFVGAARVIGQVEMMSNRDEFVKKVKDDGLEAGIGFDIGTKVESVPDEVDLVLLMTRKAGYQPMEIDKRIWNKIKSLKQIQDKREKKFIIAVDGGVNPENEERFIEAGVDVVYSEGSYFKLIDNAQEND